MQRVWLKCPSRSIPCFWSVSVDGLTVVQVECHVSLVSCSFFLFIDPVSPVDPYVVGSTPVLAPFCPAHPLLNNNKNQRSCRTLPANVPSSLTVHKTHIDTAAAPSLVP